MWPGIERPPALADTIAGPTGHEREAALEALSGFLAALAARELKDERLLYPAVARALGGSDPTGAMSRGHTEIAELAQRIEAFIAECGPTKKSRNP